MEEASDLEMGQDKPEYHLPQHYTKVSLQAPEWKDLFPPC